MRVAQEFAALGKALQSVSEKVKVVRDLEWLGIAAGEYGVQQLVYDCIVKCWHNEKFGDYLSSIVNFDWYHPTYAYRYDAETLRNLFLGPASKSKGKYPQRRSIILREFDSDRGMFRVPRFLPLSWVPLCS